MEGMHANQEVYVCVCLLSSPDWVFVSSITETGTDLSHLNRNLVQFETCFKKLGPCTALCISQQPMLEVSDEHIVTGCEHGDAQPQGPNCTKRRLPPLPHPLAPLTHLNTVPSRHKPSPAHLPPSAFHNNPSPHAPHPLPTSSPCSCRPQNSQRRTSVVCRHHKTGKA
jgi:hypothetical protein